MRDQLREIEWGYCVQKKFAVGKTFKSSYQGADA